VMLPIPLAIATLFFIRRKLTGTEFSVSMAVLWFPWIYYMAISCRSDWPLWPWYMYALRPAVCISFVVLCTCTPVQRLMEWRPVAPVLLLIFFVYLFHSSWPTQLEDVYATAQDVQRFEAKHPGIYAMGDRAGSVGYLIHSPLVQTEGLMMDKAFLENIRQRRPLLDVLKQYGVRYYVVTLLPGYSLDPQGCMDAKEPFMAGKDSPKMTAVLCQKPVFYVEHWGAQTFIYDLQP